MNSRPKLGDINAQPNLTHLVYNYKKMKCLSLHIFYSKPTETPSTVYVQEPALPTTFTSLEKQIRAVKILRLLFQWLFLSCLCVLLRHESHCYFSYCLCFSLVCGGSLINSPEGNFTSPGYDGVSNYSRNLNCEWTLSNPSQGNSSIFIHFEHFYLESHQDCQFDVLEFRVGEFNQGPFPLFIYLQYFSYA